MSVINKTLLILLIRMMIGQHILTNAADNGDDDDDAVINSDTNENTNQLLDDDDYIERHKISVFGHIVDVPGDVNCEFYAIMVLLVKRNVILDELTVTEFRQSLHDYVL